MSAELGQVRSMSEGQTEAKREQWTLRCTGECGSSLKRQPLASQQIFFFLGKLEIKAYVKSPDFSILRMN